jgi:hypothetical protein
MSVTFPVSVALALNFVFKKGKTGAETLQMLTNAFGDECLSQAAVCQWVK